MIDCLGVHGTDETKVVHDLLVMRQEFTKRGTRLANLLEGKRRLVKW